MAITSINESWSGMSAGEKSLDGQVGLGSSSRKLTAISDDPVNDTEFTVLSASGIPYVTELHPRKASHYCTGVRVKRLAPYMWEIDADYEVPVLSIQGGSALSKAPVYEWSGIASEEPIDEDVDGNAIQTQPGEAFDPPVTAERFDQRMSVQKFLPSFNSLFYSTYLGAVNSDSFAGYPAGTVRCVNISARSITNGPTTIIDATFEFQVRRGAPRTTDARAWWKRVKAQGHYVRSVISDAVVRARDGDGSGIYGYETVTPVPHQVATGYQIFPPTPAEWYEFEVYHSLPFALLGI